VPDPADVTTAVTQAREVPDDNGICGTLKSPAALHVQRTSSSASASTDMSDVRLDVSPRGTSSRCDDDDARRMSSTVFTFDINVDEQSDYDV